MADRSQKTEQPTARRLRKAREEGQFPVSREFVSAGNFLAVVAMLDWWGARWLSELKALLRVSLHRAFEEDFSVTAVVNLSATLLTAGFLPLATAAGLLVLLTFLLHLVSTNLGFSLKKFGFNFTRMNPVSKFRELGRQSVPAVVQAAVMLTVFGVTVYWIASQNVEAFFRLPFTGVDTALATVSSSVLQLLWKAAGLFTVFGFVDLFRQKRRHWQELRMSRHEISDEVKETEGRPEVRARIRRLRRDLLRRRMMRDVPKATAVIVNPTHYAVAIRYIHEETPVPKVVAKGKNFLALRIRAVAEQHQIPTIENPPLAQALYKSAEVGREIPPEFYRAIAEILAYLYQMMRGRSLK